MDESGVGSRPAVPSLKRNLLYATGGKIVFALTQFGILAVVAHLGRPEDVGALTIATALVTPLFFLTSMGMRDVHSVDELDRFTRADYVALRLIGGMVAVLLTCALVFTYQADAGFLVQATAIAFALVKYFGAQSSLNHGIFQRAERLDYVAASTIMRGVPGLLAFALAFWFSRNLPLALLCEAVAWFGTYFLIDRLFLARLGARTVTAELFGLRPRRLMSLAWWILPIGISLWLTRAAMSAPPLVLQRHADLATIGVFGAITYFHTALSMVSGALGSASAARLRRLYRTGARRQFVRLGLKLTALSTVLGSAAVLVAWLAGDPVLGFLYGETYQRGDLLVIVVLASAISIAGSPLLTAVTAGQAFRRRLANSAAAFAIAVAASLVLVPAYGVTGAAWALVVATGASLLFTAASFVVVSTRVLAPRIEAPAPTVGPDGGAR